MKQKIKSVIAEALKVNLDLITDSLSIGEIPEWDSMGNLTVIRTIEERFNIDIPMEDLFELTTVISIVNEVEKLQNV